jgi:hypothetical protein
MSRVILLPTAFLPNTAYFSLLLNKKNIYIDVHEHFVKQTIRNRCEIVSSNGPLILSVPLVNSGNKTLTCNKIISYSENWQLKHWRAIESAYRNSPYFEFFEEEIKNSFFTKQELLIEYNQQLIQTFFTILRKPITINFTESYQTQSKNDFRNEDNLNQLINHFPAYYQVFQHSIGFIPNASILDLLFNEGLYSLEYLKELNSSYLINL